MEDGYAKKLSWFKNWWVTKCLYSFFRNNKKSYPFVFFLFFVFFNQKVGVGDEKSTVSNGLLLIELLLILFDFFAIVTPCLTSWWDGERPVKHVCMHAMAHMESREAAVSLSIIVKRPELVVYAPALTPWPLDPFQLSSWWIYDSYGVSCHRHSAHPGAKHRGPFNFVFGPDANKAAAGGFKRRGGGEERTMERREDGNIKERV